MTRRIHTLFSVGFSVVVILAVGWGIALVGSPATARLQRFDQQRLDDLRTIHREIQSLCQDPDIRDQLKRPLPATLKELADLARSERISLLDPETNEPYAYALSGDTGYQLCATFSLPRKSDSEVFWNHPAGRQCFEIDALDPP